MARQPYLAADIEQAAVWFQQLSELCSGMVSGEAVLQGLTEAGKLPLQAHGSQGRAAAGMSLWGRAPVEGASHVTSAAGGGDSLLWFRRVVAATTHCWIRPEGWSPRHRDAAPQQGYCGRNNQSASTGSSCRAPTSHELRRTANRRRIVLTEGQSAMQGLPMNAPWVSHRTLSM